VDGDVSVVRKRRAGPAALGAATLSTRRSPRRRVAADVAAGGGLKQGRRAGAALLTLARPERRNPLSEAMLDALSAAIAAAQEDPEVRSIIIAAEGSVFSSGHDLGELTRHRADPDDGRAYYQLVMRRCCALMAAIIACPKPVIAAVEGAALAAGCQLVATCDLAVAAVTARFCTPGVSIGLFCSTPAVALSRNVPRKRAMEMLLLGDMLPAEAALEYGLVNRVVPAGAALETALELAGRIAALPSATLALGKRAFYRQLEMPLAEAYAYASEVMVTNMLHAEAAEGIDAFLAKRAPSWPAAER
jgi:enoyl-CoA hydratase/carnithine racemase